jgi:hypothetical protein
MPRSCQPGPIRTRLVSSGVALHECAAAWNRSVCLQAAYFPDVRGVRVFGFIARAVSVGERSKARRDPVLFDPGS